ncbi:MAG TPA: AraC family transcriptional regulator [Lachnospiraceae bacterium]|nr:AraC family transcriptional regulator [Lachnospiraceae bacterium]
MKEKNVIIEQIKKIWNINIEVIPIRNISESVFTFNNELLSSELQTFLKDNVSNKSTTYPQVISPIPMAFLGTFDYDNHLFIIGPFSYDTSSELEIRNFFRKNNFFSSKDSFPVLTIQSAVNMLSVAYSMITGHPCSESEVVINNRPELSLNMESISVYQLDIASRNENLFGYDIEKQLTEQISNGTFYISPEEVIVNLTQPSKNGILAKNNAHKQAEYLMVSAISLATKAAIAGGVSPYSARMYGDITLQKIAVSTSIANIYNIAAQALNEFSSMVQKQKNLEKQNPYIEKCKDFIAKHIYTRFRIKDLSVEFGLSEAYLSRIFSSYTGQTLQQYVISERLNAATNLLKYSPTSIGEISEYLCFNTHSHFTVSFTKKYGITPSEYRRKHTIVGFEK